MMRRYVGDRAEWITTKRPPQAGFTKSTKTLQDVDTAFPTGTIALVSFVILVLKNLFSRRLGIWVILGGAT